MKSSVSIVSLAAVAGIIGLSSAAQAQQYNWSGFYVGVEGGYASGSTDWKWDSFTNGAGTSFLNSGSGPNVDYSGGIWGGHVGYMQQSGQVVFGIDGAWDATNLSGTSNNRAFDSNGNPLDPINTSGADIKSIGLLNGRLGVAVGQGLFYGVAGLAFANESLRLGGQCTNNAGVRIAGCTFEEDGSANRTGFDVGAGVAYALGDHMIVGAEWDHIDLGLSDITLNDTNGLLFSDTVGTHPILDEVKVNLTWKFGGDRSPAPLK